jgi:hypothetical protein
LNGLNLIILRLKAKELIRPVLYRCRLLPSPLPNASPLSLPKSMVLDPQNHVRGNYSNIAERIMALMPPGALDN